MATSVVVPDSNYLLTVIEPLLSPSILPVTSLSHTSLVEVDTNSALLAPVPATFVLATIAPNELAFTVALVLLELTNVLFAVRPDEMSVAVHLIVEPVPSVLLRIAPDVDSFALDFVHVEFTLIDRAIGKCELTLAVLLSFAVLAFIDSTVGPSF